MALTSVRLHGRKLIPNLCCPSLSVTNILLVVGDEGMETILEGNTSLELDGDNYRDPFLHALLKTSETLQER